MNEIEKILSTLGLNRDNGLYYIKEESWKTELTLPSRVKRLLERKIEPTAFFCFDNKPLILFFDNPSNKSNLYKAIWNFNECPIVFIVENDSIEICTGFKYLKETSSLEKIGGVEKLNDFTYFELVTGRTWEQYKDNLNYTNRVDYHLLKNIQSARNKLIGENKKSTSNNITEEEKNRSRLVNALLGKAIFVRYLIDRKVKMRFDGKLRTWTNQEFCKLLDKPKEIQKFFEYLQDKETGFNGDLFPISSADFKKLKKEDYQVVKDLLLGNEIDINQQSLFDLYDFSIIPIEFISNVYELFIGKENQKTEGAYYTPLFLVDYILAETVEKYLITKSKELKIKNAQKQTDNYSYCKVFDPACGSGIFLVETLRKIIESYISDTKIDIKTDRDKFKTALKNLAKENIYGIDKDISSVQVAIFSVYLTLLDYLEPPGIETFQFPVLFNTNFFEADFFDESAEFQTLFQNIEFDFVLGNPPWKGSGMDSLGKAYLKNRKSKEKKQNKKYPIAINNNELVEGFVLRVSNFCKEKTQVAFIIRSLSLYSMGYNKKEFSPFRQYLLEEYFIDRVFELAPVRHEVFDRSNDKAIAPACVLFYRYANGKNTDQNIVHHISLKPSRFFSLFKIFTINRTDYKKVQQNRLKRFDWLWKVLVYGSFLDFHLIRRLKEEYPSIQKVISDKEKFVVGTGIQFSSNPTYDSKHLIGEPFLDSNGLLKLFILPEKISSFDKSKVHRIRDERLFIAPMLLVRMGLSLNTLIAKSAILNQNILFKNSITSIKALNKKDINILYNICAIFSTSFFSYYAINTFASIGIEREQTQNYDKFSLPYLELNTKDSVHKIEEAYKEIHSEKKTLIDTYKIQTLQETIDDEINKINENIFQKLELNDMELDLIDYALNVSRIMITKKDKDMEKLFSALIFEDSILKNYAQLFLNRFQFNLSNHERKFVVEIWYTKQIIGMFFKVISIKDYKTDVIWINKQNNDLEILSFLTKISSQKITDQLFVQKDIRGFAKEYFYIFKPNEKRLWHKAIGHLDVNEFSDAILKAGRDAK